MPVFSRLCRLAALCCLLATLPAAVTIVGQVQDSVSQQPVAFGVGDLAQYREQGAGSWKSFTVVADPPGAFQAAHLFENLTYEMRFTLAGYAVRQETIHVWTGLYTPTPQLVRSSHLAAIAFADSPSAFYDDEVLLGSISLSEVFPKAATVIELSLLHGSFDRVELQDAAGVPLSGGLIEIPAGATSVGFRLAGRPRSQVDGDSAIQLRATAPSIPLAGRQVDSPALTLRDARRVVTLNFGDADGVVHRYAPDDGAPLGATETAAGGAEFKGLPAAAALYGFTPGAAAD